MSEKIYSVRINGKMTIRNDELMTDLDFKNIVEIIKNAINSLKINGVDNITVTNDDVIIFTERPQDSFQSHESSRSTVSDSATAGKFGNVRDFISPS